MDGNRRDFLALLGSGWVALNWPSISAAAHAAHAFAAGTSRGAPEVLSASQLQDIEAASAQIIPTDDVAGAREAGVAYFIDRALGGFYKHHRAEFLADYEGFAADVEKLAPGVRFAALSSAQQIEALERADGSRFFETLRLLTIIGFLASPAYGGNRDQAGWKAVGFDDQHVFSPPFGFYDRDYPGFQPYDKPTSR